jgi:DNA polymerase III delta prime subunit
MNIRISKRIGEEIGAKLFKPWVNNTESWNWRRDADISLVPMDAEELNRFEKVFLDNQHVHGTKTILKDIATWRIALSGKTPKVRAVRNMKSLMVGYLGKIEGHRIYEKYDSENEIWLPYYVEEVEYHPEVKSRDGRTRPAHLTMDLMWEEFGGKKKRTVTFWPDDSIGFTVIEALARKGFYAETPEYRQRYLAEAKRFGETVPQIGKQFWADGTAVDDLDGNRKRDDSWYWRNTNTLPMEKNGSKSRVVVDVFVENEKERDRDREEYINEYFWVGSEHKELIAAQNEEEDAELEELAEDLDIERQEIEIPIHPKLAVFDLKRHLRLRIHVNYLTEYVYDKKLAEKLILPAEQKDLVKMLINHDDKTFKDIVAGKTGGIVVLLTGLPGVGKTLTAEVYAESEEKALYSIQCSQLGTDPNELEDELLKVFARAQRWKAVMLLDEADVYVHERGNDLQQNAIVGVFLRVLEYQSSILFLTTNRPEDVDDAIASRCIARLSYQVPGADDQAKIWKVLSESSSIPLAASTISEIVAYNPELSGRDVKNLLKLAALVKKNTGKPITKQTIDFVKKFKPTGKQEKA